MSVLLRKPVPSALIAALLPECACLWIALRNPEGLPSNAGALDRFLDYGTQLMHWPAKLLAPLFHAFPDSQIAFFVRIALILAVGYLDWTVLICFLLYGARIVARVHAPPPA